MMISSQDHLTFESITMMALQKVLLFKAAALSLVHDNLKAIIHLKKFILLVFE